MKRGSMKRFVKNTIRFLKTVFICVGFASIPSIVHNLPTSEDLEVKTLAKNIYFEARNSSIEDQIATAIVVLNRGTPTKEVYKYKQFSWTSVYSEPADNKYYRRALAVAEMVYNNPDLWREDYICKHYAAVSASFPEEHWTNNFKRRKQIGKHYYYCN